MDLIRRCILSLAVLGCACFASARNEDFDVDAQPVFLTLSSQGHTIPVNVTIVNRGPDAKGEIQVGGSVHTSYPVELPRGAKKRILVYASDPIYGPDNDIILSTDRCHIATRLVVPSSNYENVQNVLLITDTAGELAFLRQDPIESKSAGMSRGFKDLYVKASAGPDRASGFRGLSTIVLGSGSERLTDTEVAAIKRWVLIGGTLVFVGGASTPVLSDPRWQELLPSRTFAPRTIVGSSYLSSIGEAPMRSAFTITEPVPSHGKVDSLEGLRTRRTYGLGEVQFLVFNPFENPIAQWPGRARAMRELLRSVPGGASMVLAEFQGQANEFDDYPSRSPYSRGADRASNPFQTTLPPTSKVATLLAIYFLAVVPLNFFVLRKVKRGELAWLTAPVLSLLAAGVLFSTASGLYSAKEASSTVGLLIAQEGTSDGYFVGSSQMFFPSGGSIDLGLRGVETIDVQDEGRYYSYRSNGSGDMLEAVDVGEVQIPALRASNLAFKEMTYRQHVQVPPTFKVDLSRDSKGLKCTVRNIGSSNATLTSIFMGGHEYQLGPDLAPGTAETIELNNNSVAGGGDDNLNQFTSRHPVLIVLAGLHNFRPGPQVGADLASHIEIAYCKGLP